MSGTTEHLWTHKLCCVEPINVDPNEAEKFDKIGYFSQLEAMADAGCQIVVSPAMKRCTPDRQWPFQEFYTGRGLWIYLGGLATHPERVHYVRRPV